MLADQMITSNKKQRTVTLSDRQLKAVHGKILINKDQLLAMIPLAYRTIFDWEKKGKFPKHIVLAGHYLAWDLSEIEAWIKARKTSRERPVRPGDSPRITGVGQLH